MTFAELSFYGFSILSDLLIIFPPVGLVIWLIIKKDWISCFKVLTVLTIVILLTTFLKTIFPVPRPFSQKLDSYPSRHTALIAGVSFVAFEVNPLVGTFFILLTLITGWTRIIILAHYFIDVIGGILAGLVSWLITKKIFIFLKPYLIKN